MVAEGWSLFNEALEDTAPGELPHMMRKIMQHLWTPPPVPVPIVVPMGPPKAPPAPEAPQDAPPAPEAPQDARQAPEDQPADAPKAEPTPSGSNEGDRGTDTPIPFKTLNENGDETFHYRCPRCDTVRGTRRGMDSHIRQAHTLVAFLCSFCEFSTFNQDSLNRHERKAHS